MDIWICNICVCTIPCRTYITCFFDSFVCVVRVCKQIVWHMVATHMLQMLLGKTKKSYQKLELESFSRSFFFFFFSLVLKPQRSVVQIIVLGYFEKIWWYKFNVMSFPLYWVRIPLGIHSREHRYNDC